MKLRRLKTKNNIFLAPLEEVNDIAFRLLCKKAGAGLTWTPLTSPLSPQKMILKDKPVLQLFATSTNGIKKFMKKYNRKVSAWDFNLGCPVPTAKRHGHGAFLKDLDIIEEILKTMRENTKKPLFVKIRKSDISYEVLYLAQMYCDAIIIHPRTIGQMYSGEPDIKWAKEFKKISKIPVIFSGNIDEKNVTSFLNDFDGVMIGRKAIGDPNIFSRILEQKEKIEFKDYLNLADKYKLRFRQIKFQAMQFSKGEKKSRSKRAKMVYAKDRKELEDIFYDKQGSYYESKIKAAVSKY